MPGLLRAITLAGFTSGVEFVKFEPQNSTNYEYYAENPVEITVVGGYHEVGSFFSELSSLSRLVTVRVLRMFTLSGGDEGETVTATFQASAYSVSGSHVRPTGSSVVAPRNVTPKRGPMKSPPRIEE